MWTLALLALAFLSQSIFAQIIPADRRTIWQGNVGVPGGIPARSTIYTTVPAGSSSSTIQAALDACPSNQVVLLQAGTYNLSSTLNMRKNGVTLRGAGPGNTILNAGGLSCAVYIVSSTTYDWNTPNAAHHKSWTGGYSQGSTSITVSDTGDLTVGRLIFLDQLNDANTSAVGACGVNPGGYTSMAYPNDGRDRYQQQVARVTAINGNTLTITPGLFAANWQASLQPGIWWESANPVEGSGVEDLWIVGNNQNIYAVQLGNAYGCWVKNTRITGARRYVWLEFGSRCEFRHCFLEVPVTADDYGFAMYHASGVLVEDNMSQGVQSPILLCGTSGSVFGYNYFTNFVSPLNWMNAGIALHGNHPNMNLFEGNYAAEWGVDNCWGSSAYNTAFRNRFTGLDEYAPGVGNAVQAIDIAATNRFQNVLGNVLGTTGKNTYYESYAQSGSCHENGRIYFLGYFPSSCSSQYDPITYSSLLRVCNWDSANNGIVLGGYQPSDLPASYYLPSKPAWFGSLRWPAIDPSDPAYSGSRTNIPAGHRFLLGIEPPSGPANLPPIVVLTASRLAGVAPLGVSFSSTGSRDPEGVALTFNWTFGDGHTSTAANPSNYFILPGAYNVQLNVSDGVNTTSTNLSINVTLLGLNLTPTALAGATPFAGVAPLTVAFSSAGSFDPEGTALTYNWNFGDGTTSTAANPSKTYQASGAYIAQLKVSDGTNTSLPSTVIISVGTAANGLVAAYGFEEGSGSATADVSGNGNAGAITGATWSNSGKFGNSLSFGPASLVTINDSASLHLSAGMTLEAWVYPTSLSGWMNLIYKPIDASSAAYVMQGSTSPAQQPALSGSFASGNLSAPTALALNTWSHVAATYDGATMKFYVNGILAGTRPQTGAIAASSMPLTLGGNSFYGENWAGRIDEVRIYNRALSQAEIHADINIPVLGPITRPNSPPQAPRIVSQ